MYHLQKSLYFEGDPIAVNTFEDLVDVVTANKLYIGINFNHSTVIFFFSFFLLFIKFPQNIVYDIQSFPRIQPHFRIVLIIRLYFQVN